MVILANRHPNLHNHNNTLPNPLVSIERDTPAVTQARLASKLEAGSFLPSYMRGEMPPDLRRTLSLSLTLTHWTPLLASQGLSSPGATLNASRTANHSDLPLAIASPIASPATAPPLRTAIRDAREHAATDEEIRGRPGVVGSQHATDRFPRFFAYLLRNGTPNPESDEGRSRPRPPPPRPRRSADPGGSLASLATIPDAPTQCGVGDETGLQSCAAASAAGTWARLPIAGRSPSPLRVSTSPTPAAQADTSRTAPASASEHHLGAPSQKASISNSVPVSVSTAADSAAMASHLSSASSSRGGGGSGERGVGSASSQVSFPSSTNQLASTSTHFAQYTDAELDPDGDEQDEQAQDVQSQGSGTQTPEGQPKKKKTRRAGVAITRVRRMQREVRRLAEEEEANAQRQQPGRSLLQLQPIQVQPMYPGNVQTLHMRMGSPTSPRYGTFQGGLSGAGGHTSPPPTRYPTSPVSITGGSSASLNVGAPSRPHARCEPSPPGLASAVHPHTATPRGPPYDRILESGDDVVVLQLPSTSPPSIWAYRPEERDTTRPRGGSA